MKKPDLSKLSKEEKLRLIDLLEEKERRRLERRDSYEPNPGQVKVHRCEAKIRAVFSGNGGGKTTLAVQEAIWAATGFNPVLKKNTPVPARVICVLDRPSKVQDVWLPEIKKWYPLKTEQLNKRGKPYYEQIVFDNGSEIIFFFHDTDPMAFESIELDWAIFDEPPPRHVYIGLRRGGRKKGRNSRYLLIGTPIAAPWLRKEIYEPWSRGESPDTECFRYSTHENKENLGEGEIESFERSLSEKERQIRLHGSFFDLEGLALAHLFDRSSHLVPAEQAWPKNWPCVVAIDPHPRKAHTAILLGATPKGELRVLKEMSSRAVPSEFARELRRWADGYRVVDWVCDSLGSSELTGGDGNLSFIAVLNKNGVRCRATTFSEKKDEAWIQMIQETLATPPEPDNFGQREPRLKIADDCKGLIADIETVEWTKYRNVDEYKPKLAMESKDFLSCLKYALATQPRFSKGREKVIRGGAPGMTGRKAFARNP